MINSLTRLLTKSVAFQTLSSYGWREVISKNVSAKFKRGRKSRSLDGFEQRTLPRILLKFYRKPSPEFPTFDKIQAKYKDMPDFSELSKSSLRKSLSKLRFCYKWRNKKMQVYQRNDITAQIPAVNQRP